MTDVVEAVGVNEQPSTTSLRVRRLGWAGVELEADGKVVVIDLFLNAEPLKPWVGEPRDELTAPTRPVDIALVTHMHLDHADPEAIAAALKPDGVVLRPERATGEFLETAAVQHGEEGLADARVMRPWETAEFDGVRVTAVPAADGTGDPQVSWVVEMGGQRVLHCGDTLWHGWFWLTKMRCGPIDLAFLPVNGAIIDLPHRQPPSPLPACMDVQQAAVAAHVLEAGIAVPMHHTTFAAAPHYFAGIGDDVRFVSACERLGIDARALLPGEDLAL